MTRITRPIVAGLVLLASAGAAWACGSYGIPEYTPKQLSEAAFLALDSPDENKRTGAIWTLRRAGQPGLDALIARAGSSDLTPAERELIDQVAQQKDASFSGLYWYTDIRMARMAARQLNKPILSLRLLGKLTDSYSCANSRFFRTVLYANPDVAKYLRENYVLHWQSERPVPVITIDFGDGRVVKRTITGNSVHYVLDARGRVIEAIPGLYTPRDFLRIVQTAQPYAVASSTRPDAERAQFMTHYHKLVEDDIARRFGAALAAEGVNVPKKLVPDAADAAPRARGKAMIEMPVLVAMDPGFAAKLSNELTDDQWAAIGRAPAPGRALMGFAPTPQPAKGQARPRILHENSIALMRSQNPDASEATFKKTVESFERVIAIDTARNELTFRRTIHKWLAKGADQTLRVDELNTRVYAELFLTPANDPNLGLLPTTVYTALPADECPTDGAKAEPTGPTASAARN